MSPDRPKLVAQAELIAVLRRNRLFEVLSDEELRDIAGMGRVIRVEAETRLFEKGDTDCDFYAVLSGQIATHTSSENGKVLTLSILDPGDIVGEVSLIDGEPRAAGASALTAVEIFRMERPVFLDYLATRPDLCLRMMRMLCERLRLLSDTVEDAMFRDVPRRLARRLLLLAESYGREIEDGRVRIQLPLSQEALASMLGITREMVNKSLKTLKAAGAVTYLRGYLVLDDLERIRDLAGERSGFDRLEENGPRRA